MTNPTAGTSGPPIGVLGSTGPVGRAVLTELRAAGMTTRPITVNPQHPHEGTCRAIAGDVLSLRRAVGGCVAVFVASRAGARLAHHETALVEACCAEGIAHVVKLSSIVVDDPAEPAGAHHRAVEDYLEAATSLLALAGATVVRAPTFTTALVDHPDPPALARLLRAQPSGTVIDLVAPAEVGARATAALLRGDHGFHVERLDGIPASVTDAARLVDASAHKGATR